MRITRTHGSQNTAFGLLAPALACLAVLLLSGCSSSDDDSSEQSSTQEPAGEDEQGMPGGGGVSGEIASVADGVLQVQDSESQTAVTYTADTTITEQVEATLADVTTGVCVSGAGGAPAEDDSSQDSGSTVQTVTISTPVDGVCTSTGPGGGGGAMPSGTPEEMPEGSAAPDMDESDRPEMPEGEEMPEGGFGGGFTTGVVTAVDGTTITVETTSMEGETTSEQITVGDTTTYLKSQEATSAALVVGQCVVAQGEYDGEDYAATSLAVEAATDNGCQSSFGGPSGRDDE